MGAVSARETPALLAARGVLSRADGLSAVPRPRAEMRRQGADDRSPAGARRRDSALRRAEPQSSQRPFHAHRPDCVVRPSGRVPGCCEAQRLSAIRASGMFGLWFAKILADFEISEIAGLPPLFCYNS